MTKRRVLVTGATGFIGRNLVSTLSRRPDLDVHAVHFSRPAYPMEGVTWHHADLRVADQVARVLDGQEVLIHAAATTSGAKDIVTRPYIHTTDNAVMSSLLFREAFERKLAHVVFFSCTIMYQSSAKGLTEADYNPAEPLHARYFGAGYTKLYLEKMCEFFASLGNTRYTAIRHSNVYGPFDKFDLERSHVCGATITKVLTAQDKVTVWGTGEEGRDLLFVDDLVDMVERIIARQPTSFGLYNCGAGKAVTVRELVERLIALSGRDLAIEHDLSRPTIPTSLFLDCSLARETLGWTPSTSLEDGLRKTLDWWRAHIDPSTLRPTC